MVLKPDAHTAQLNNYTCSLTLSLSLLFPLCLYASLSLSVSLALALSLCTYLPVWNMSICVYMCVYYGLIALELIGIQLGAFELA